MITLSILVAYATCVWSPFVASELVIDEWCAPFLALIPGAVCGFVLWAVIEQLASLCGSTML